jgi:hypothetical protein
MPELVIHSSAGRRTITVHRDGANITLSVLASRNGEPVTITAEEADALAAALTRKWPMIGPPTTAALSLGDWRPANTRREATR